MTPGQLHALTKAFSTAAARAQLSADPAVRGAWMEAGVQAALGKRAEQWQERCLEVGFQYTRASDDHWVDATVEQMQELLAELLGVEVRVRDYEPPQVDDAAGRRAFGTRFLAPFYGSGSGETGRTLQRPIGTLTTRARWAVIDGERMRMVSATEGRKLMGFPDDYRLPANEATAWHLLGNAVCPPQAADLIDAIRRAA